MHTGTSIRTVHQVISDYNRLGAEGIETPGSGGRRHSYLSAEEEESLLDELKPKAKRGEITTRAQRSFLGELKTDVDDFQHSRAEAKEIKQTKSALGRWSNRIILDKQDNISLNVGDLITHQAIERARTADMLDVLLDSVDDRTKVANEEQSSESIEASLKGREQKNAP